MVTGRKSDIPRKNAVNEQARNVPDPRDIGETANPDPEDLNVDAGQLFIQATEQTRMALCLSDPYREDMPIVYANQAFCDLTGYSREEVIGKNCRFLQGKDTNPRDPKRIAEALSQERVAVVDILNYRKDGTPFWNGLHIGPIYGRDGKLQYFYGSQWDVTEVLRQREEVERQRRVTEEMHHRTGNLFAVLSAIVRMSARGETDAKQLAENIEGRLGALARAHQMSIASEQDDAEASNLLSLVDAVLKPYRGENSSKIAVEGEPLEMPRDFITPIGLTLHELATNAVKYGALSTGAGTVSVEWAEDDETLSICWIERGGPAPDREGQNATSGTGSGSRIVNGILAGIQAKIDRTYDPKGLTATISVPRRDSLQK